MLALWLTNYVHRAALKTPELNCIVRNDRLSSKGNYAWVSFIFSCLSRVCWSILEQLISKNFKRTPPPAWHCC